MKRRRHSILGVVAPPPRPTVAVGALVATGLSVLFLMVLWLL